MEIGEPIARGNTADIYLFHGTIIKLFQEQISAMDAKSEADKQQIAFSRGIPVPRVFDVCRVNGRQAIIMEHISGVTLGELIRQDTENIEYYLGLSVEMQIRLHAKSVTAIEAVNMAASKCNGPG